MSKARSILLALSLAAIIATSRAAPLAQRGPAGDVEVKQSGAGVSIDWQGTVGLDDRRAPAVEGWPESTLDGYRVPARLIALRVRGDAPIELRIERLDSEVWPGKPPARDETQHAAGPAALPEAPVVVLREARAAGARIAVLALTPVFARDGQTRIAKRLVAHVASAAPLAEGAAASISRPPAARAPLSLRAAAVPPGNPLAGRQGYVVRVSEPGLQRISGAALQSVGLDIAALNPALLQLWHLGAPVALHELGTADGQLQPWDELRFFAPAAGDRWNTGAVYYLTVEAQPGRRFTQRSVAPQSAPLSGTARQTVHWRRPSLYDSNFAGPDGDHWFSAELRGGPGLPDATLTIPLSPSLPPVAGESSVTVSGSATQPSSFQLRATAGGAAAVAGAGPGDVSLSLRLPDNAPNLSLALLPSAKYSALELQRISWQRPVALEFGGRGASFEGLDGRWRYRLSGLPQGYLLYDVSEAGAPVVLDVAAAPVAEFEDSLSGRSYVLAGPGTLATAEVAAYQAAGLAAPRNADAVYIAPATFHAALAPLLAHRRSQGFAVALVDVQAVYDNWSSGYVSPAAIRSFLQYAAATWSRSPRSVVLVGDGTSDPHNYLGRNNSNWIPPYLLMVDPWLGETACETCFGQLDGADPLADALPDLAIGRLPVKSSAELSALVDKLVGYERAQPSLLNAGGATLIADNFRDAAGRVDAAGDFAAVSDAAAAQLPAGMQLTRVYYDPSPGAPAQPWREPDAVRAHRRVVAALDAGSALAIYTGHSHYWQWASTDLSAAQTSLLDLYDADVLHNAARLPVLLEMTCLTSAFQEPATSGTTIDERLLLRPGGGAAAVWGPTGLGVAHGHESLLSGFLRTLRQSPPSSANLGSLIQSGYLELFTQSGCCQDTLRTFALLGDPLTVARIAPSSRVFAPSITRR